MGVHGSLSVDFCSVYLAMLFLYIMKCILVFWEYRVCASEPLISWGIQYGGWRMDGQI